MLRCYVCAEPLCVFTRLTVLDIRFCNISPAIVASLLIDGNPRATLKTVHVSFDLPALERVLHERLDPQAHAHTSTMSEIAKQAIATQVAAYLQRVETVPLLRI